MSMKLDRQIMQPGFLSGLGFKIKTQLSYHIRVLSTPPLFIVLGRLKILLFLH